MIQVIDNANKSLAKIDLERCNFSSTFTSAITVLLTKTDIESCHIFCLNMYENVFVRIR